MVVIIFFLLFCFPKTEVCEKNKILFGAELKYICDQISRWFGLAGYVESLDQDYELVVPEDDYGLHAIDILDPSWVSWI